MVGADECRDGAAARPTGISAVIEAADIAAVEALLGGTVNGRVSDAVDRLIALLEADVFDDLTDRDMAQLTVIGAYVLAAVAVTMAPPLARDGLSIQLDAQLHGMMQVLVRRSVAWDGGGRA